MKLATLAPLFAPFGSAPAPAPSGGGALLLQGGGEVLREDDGAVLLQVDGGSESADLLLQSGDGLHLESGGKTELEGQPQPVLTLRQAVRAWLVGKASVTAVVGQRIYWGIPSQRAAYPCLTVSVTAREYGHNLDGADGTSIATVEVAALGLEESDCIAAIESIRDFADGFRGLQGGVAILTCFLDDESDPAQVLLPDGSDDYVYAATIDYRIKHRVPKPSSVTQSYA